MKCPSCGGLTRVLETREDRRRRACEACNHRFSTVEVLMGARQAVVQVEQPAAAPAAPVVETPKQTKEEKAQAKVAARRRLEEMRDRKRYAFNPFDEDTNFIPDNW